MNNLTFFKKTLFFKNVVLILGILMLGSVANASDFILPNSGGEPVTVDISNLNTTSSIDVSIDTFGNQPRTYRSQTTMTLVIFPPPISTSEKTLEVKAGNSSVIRTISFRPSPQGILKSSLLPDTQDIKANNSITKISDGRVVLIGGSKNIGDGAIDSLEIFSSESGKSEKLKTPNGLTNLKLKLPRGGHTATYIGISESPIGMISGPVEQILLAGGFSTENKILDSLEIVEIKQGTNQATSTILSSKKSKLKKGRILHTANLLPDGRVVFIGGQGKINNTSTGAINSIEIFDPATLSVVKSNISLNTPRLLHTTTNLQDGNILIAGGFTNDSPNSFGLGMATEICELLNTGNLSIKKINALVRNEGVGGHSATLLTNGLVLVLGGSSDFFTQIKNDNVKGKTRDTIQFYNPFTESFSLVKDISDKDLHLKTSRFLHSSVLLPNGDVAIIGGSNVKDINSTTIASSPVSLIEVINPDLISFSSSSLKAQVKDSLDTFNGRILPSAILVTPKNKTKGFFLSSDINTYINSGIYLTGGYTNGFGRIPTKSSEFIQIVSNNSIEGRKLELNPEAIIGGSYIKNLIVNLANFSKIPSLKASQQSINLSAANSFKKDLQIIASNNEITSLKATANNNSLIISPLSFQTGETITISKQDSLVNGEYEILVESTNPAAFFVPTKIKVNVSDIAKPFLASDTGSGISISSESENKSASINLKVLSSDGNSESNTVPTSTTIIATVKDPQIANLSGSGISSVTGNLSTQFIVNGVMPGNTYIDFTINSSDVIGLSIPVQVSSSPSFSSTPIDIEVLSKLLSEGLSTLRSSKLDSLSFSLDEVRLKPQASLFPFYIPINLTSSIDNSNKIGTFTIRPIFGLDLLSSAPRTLINNAESDFRSNVESPSVLAAIVPKDNTLQSTAYLALTDGIKSLKFDNDISKNINSTLSKLNGINDLTDIESFEFNNASNTKVVALKGNMLSIIDTDTGLVDNSVTLSSPGRELELTKINNQDAAVVSVGREGIDLIYPITEINPRIVNFQLRGESDFISILDSLSNNNGPFAITYDGISSLAIVNLTNLTQDIETIDLGSPNIKKIIYAGKFNINSSLADLAIGYSSRKIILIDLTNKTTIPVVDSLKIKTNIEDLLVIDGIAYIALGDKGVSAISIGSLLDGDGTEAEITTFTENRFIQKNVNGTITIKTKPIIANKLKAAKPFLLVSGSNNPISIIKVVP